MATVEMMLVPYDSGHRDARMGAGPLHLAGAGAADRLRAGGHEVAETVLEAGTGWRSEIATGFELMGLVADRCREAASRGAVPVLLAGNCGITVGAVAGAGAAGRRIGVVWLDAHADFNTPDTTPGGFLDGMGLAVLTGRCWQRLAAAAVPGHRPVPDEAVILAGARDFSAGEEEAVAASAIGRLTPAQLAAVDLGAAVDRMAAVVDAVHLHVDLDVHDPSIAPANGFAAPGGPTAAQVRQVARTVAGRLPISSAVLASYDPACDREDRMRDTALDLLGTLGELLPG